MSRRLSLPIRRPRPQAGSPSAARPTTALPGKLTLRWQEPALPDGSPSITGYDVRYREVSTPALEWTELEGVATTANLEVPAILATSITGLKSNTSYEAQVRSVSGPRTSAWSPGIPLTAATAKAQLTVALSRGSYAVDEGAATEAAVLVTPTADRSLSVSVTASGIGASLSGLSSGRSSRHCPRPGQGDVYHLRYRGCRLARCLSRVDTGACWHRHDGDW